MGRDIQRMRKEAREDGAPTQGRGAPMSPATPVSEKLPQEDAGFQLEPTSEQRVEQPDRELRRTPLEKVGPHTGRAVQAGKGTKGALACTGSHCVR